MEENDAMVLLQHSYNVRLEKEKLFRKSILRLYYSGVFKKDISVILGISVPEITRLMKPQRPRPLNFVYAVYVKKPYVKKPPRIKKQHYIKKPPRVSKYFNVIEDLEEFKKLKGRDTTRELVRIRDNHTCQTCKKKWEKGTRRFHVHHLNGICGKKSRGYDKVSEMDGLITLCPKCHFNHPEHRFKLNNYSVFKAVVKPLN